MKSTKYDWSAAVSMGAQIALALQDLVERCVIAGSVARGALEVSDLELLLIDRDGQAHERLDKWLAAGLLRKRINSRGNAIGWGGKNRSAEVYDPRYSCWMPVDFFFCRPDQWAVYRIVRTGDSNVARLLVTQRAKGGFLPDQYHITDWRVWKDTGEAVPDLNEEIDVFKLIGVPFLGAYRRVPAHMDAWAKSGLDYWHAQLEAGKLGLRGDLVVLRNDSPAPIHSTRILDIARLYLKANPLQAAGKPAEQRTWVKFDPTFPDVWNTAGAQPRGLTMAEVMDAARTDESLFPHQTKLF